MTKFITTIVLAASVLAGVGAAQAGPGKHHKGTSTVHTDFGYPDSDYRGS